MRINKFIAQCGIASRRKAEELILSGKVSVNGEVCTNLATNVDEMDSVFVNGNQIYLPNNLEYYMLNKPKGYVCSASDDRGRKTVIDLIPTNARIFPVGRLDYDSEGLLLLTNDGELTYKLTHPKNEIEKTYVVNIEGDVSNDELNRLQKGVTIDGGVKFSPCKIKRVIMPNKNQSRFEIILHEGKNREIRRMFEAIGKNVAFLKRVKIADLKLGGLNRGEYRKLSTKEVNYLKSL